jgi:hypothetical protein
MRVKSIAQNVKIASIEVKTNDVVRDILGYITYRDIGFGGVFCDKGKLQLQKLYAQV